MQFWNKDKLIKMMDATMFQYKLEFRKTQLEGILTDCILVYSNIILGGEQIKNNENIIRDEIAKYLKDDAYKENHTSTVKFFHVDTEVTEGKNGRTDLRFLQVDPYKGQNNYFTIECKRLDGKNNLSKEYVLNGMERFTKKKKYDTPLGYNAMMGFIVKSLNVNETCRVINSNLSLDEWLVKMQEEIAKGCYKFESKHILPRNITLLHLWLDFSSNIKNN